MRSVLKSLIASAVVFSTVAISNAEELNLADVNSQFALLLSEAASLVNADNLHVLPLRTNAELQAISTHCEMILGSNDTDIEIPAICAAIDLPIDGDGSEPYEFANNEFFVNVEFSSN